MYIELATMLYTKGIVDRSKAARTAAVCFKFVPDVLHDAQSRFPKEWSAQIAAQSLADPSDRFADRLVQRW
jgi:hypothetical protein